MLQRGKKSSTGVLAIVPGERAKPPDGLNTEQRKVWRATVAANAVTWLTEDAYPLLINYCRHVVTASELSAQIGQLKRVDLSDRADVMTYDRLLKMRLAETKSLVMLATALRLTPHSRLKAETAATAHDNAGGGGGKPWQAA